MNDHGRKVHEPLNPDSSDVRGDVEYETPTTASDHRYDVSYGTGRAMTPLAWVDTHFCREWDDDGGCYGTKPDHGFSWREARQLMVEFHEQQAAEWREKQENDWWPSDYGKEPE